MDKIIYGGDTETVHGHPNSLQFYSEDVACSDIYFVSDKDAAKTFLKWCGTRRRNHQHVVYVHNLAFDLIEFLWGSHEKLVENGGEFEFTNGAWNIRGLYGSPTYCTVSRGHDLQIILVDSFSFFRGTLAQVADIVCPDLPKLARIRDIGQRRFTAKDSKFVAYAMRDAVITYHAGKAIEELHREFDLKQCISMADLAARIFRHRFLSYSIPQPSNDVVCAALDSYHGGKNNVTVEPGWYTDVSGIDISSAYPHAMRELPAFSNSKLYRKFRGGNRSVEVPPYGVYCVSGVVQVCKWPVLFDHSFKPLSGRISDIWVQGFELNEALRSKEFKPTKIIGHLYDHERDNQAPGLRAFCDDFYARKQGETDPIKRHGYKLILNSISGKFIQTRKRTLKCYVDIDSGGVQEAAELVAGGMFHPFIASAITAHTRARIHRLEHHYKAMHTATDGIFTRDSPDKSGRHKVVRKASKLGDLTHEVQGDLLLIRNKCYIVYGDKGGFDSRAFMGKRILKYAKHGFQGSVYDLERLVATRKRKYTIMHANKLKESIKSGSTPNDFVEREYTLRVGPIKVHI